MSHFFTKSSTKLQALWPLQPKCVMSCMRFASLPIIQNIDYAQPFGDQLLNRWWRKVINLNDAEQFASFPIIQIYQRLLLLVQPNGIQSQRWQRASSSSSDSRRETPMIWIVLGYRIVFVMMKRAVELKQLRLGLRWALGVPAHPLIW